MKQMERFKEYKDHVFSTLDSHLHSMETLMKSMKGEMEIVFDPKTNHYVTVEVHKTWASAPLRDVHVTELGREEALMICKRALHKWAVTNRRDPNLIRVETDKLTLQWGDDLRDRAPHGRAPARHQPLSRAPSQSRGHDQTGRGPGSVSEAADRQTRLVRNRIIDKRYLYFNFRYGRSGPPASE